MMYVAIGLWDSGTQHLTVSQYIFFLKSFVAVVGEYHQWLPEKPTPARVTFQK
jgi:hypothetical protein